MSRIGKKVILVPNTAQLAFDENTNVIRVIGPLGELQFKLHPRVKLNVENNQVSVSIEDKNDRKQRAIWGTSRAIINNMIQGVTTGFSKEVELNGVGFKMELQSNQKKLVVYIGFSHPVYVDIPDGIQLSLEKNKLVGKSIDKQLIGDFFANLHNMKPCDPYKQKGFRFPGKYYLKKVGKKAGK